MIRGRTPPVIQTASMHKNMLTPVRRRKDVRAHAQSTHRLKTTISSSENVTEATSSQREDITVGQTFHHKYAGTWVRAYTRTRGRGYARTRVRGYSVYAGTRVCVCARVLVCQYAGTRVRGYARKRVRVYAGTRVRAYARTRARGHWGTCVRGHVRVRGRGHAFARVRGYAGTRVHACACTPVRRYAGTRVRGYSAYANTRARVTLVHGYAGTRLSVQLRIFCSMGLNKTFVTSCVQLGTTHYTWRHSSHISIHFAEKYDSKVFVFEDAN